MSESVRALLAQWREKAQQMTEFDGSADVVYEQCADELETALKPLADLAAEMQRCAEDELTVWPSSLWAKRALAWAARLQALQEQ